MNLLTLRAFFERRWARWSAFILLLSIAFGVGRLSAIDAGADGAGASRISRSASRAQTKAQTTKSLADMTARLLKDPASLTPEEIAALSAHLDRTQAQELFAALNGLQGRERERLLRAFIGSWAEKDPSGAVELLQGMGPSRLGYSLMSDAFVFWGQKAPDKALQWLSENRGVEPTGVFNERVQQVIRGWAEKDPQTALQYALNSMPTGSRADNAQQSQAVRIIAATMAREGNIAEAVSLFSSMPEGDLRTSALNSVAREWGRNDPQAALQWVQNLGEAGDSMRATVLRSWSEQDPASAAQWAASLPADDAKKGEWMAQAVSQWTQYDLDTPAQWLNNMPNSPEKDGAVLAFTNRAAREDPESALAWAGQVSNGEWRDRAMALVGVQWSREDPEAFKSYVQTSAELTAEQRTLMQKVSDQGFRAVMQMGMPTTGINGGQFNMEQLRSLGLGGGGPGGAPNFGGGGGGGRRGR